MRHHDPTKVLPSFMFDFGTMSAYSVSVFLDARCAVQLD